MKIEKLKPKVVTEVIAIKCDVCKTVYANDLIAAVEDVFEIQEMWQIENTGGFASVFGDGIEYSLDICQHCIKDLLGKYIRIKDNE